MEQKSAYDCLLHEVCSGLGFCGSVVDGQPAHVDHFIPEHGPVSADEFVEWVFRAEGMDPSGDAATEYAAILRQAFIRHLGSDCVDASRLK